MTRIEGFWIYWGSEHYVWAEREAAPKHKYRFEVSADWRQIGKLWISPVDVARSGLQNRQKKLLRSSCGKNSARTALCYRWGWKHRRGWQRPS